MQDQKIAVSGLNIAYRAWGNPKNPPIIALHGWLDNANSFESLAPHLQDDYYIMALDFPGHGHSDSLPEISNYHFLDAVFITIQIIDALKFKKVHLMGHSLGACVASIAGGVAPNRVLSLALIEGLGPFSSPESTACAQLQTYLDFTQKINKASKGYENIETAAKARAMRGYVSLDLAKKLCERGLMEQEGLFYWRHDRRLFSPSPLRMTEQQIISCLKEIQVNTFLIWGNKGFIFDPPLLQGRTEVIKHLKIASLEGGHHIHMEQPAEVGKLLSEFYSSLGHLE